MEGLRLLEIGSCNPSTQWTLIKLTTREIEYVSQLSATRHHAHKHPHLPHTMSCAQRNYFDYNIHDCKLWVKKNTTCTHTIRAVSSVLATALCPPLGTLWLWSTWCRNVHVPQKLGHECTTFVVDDKVFEHFSTMEISYHPVHCQALHDIIWFYFCLDFFWVLKWLQKRIDFYLEHGWKSFTHTFAWAWNNRCNYGTQSHRSSGIRGIG